MTATATRVHGHGFDRDTARLVRSYVDQVAQLPWAQKVLVEKAKGGHPRVWTVISAPPFEFQFREAVFQAELAARQAAPTVLVDFRLVNPEELDHEAELTLPTDHAVVFERTPEV